MEVAGHSGTFKGVLVYQIVRHHIRKTVTLISTTERKPQILRRRAMFRYFKVKDLIYKLPGTKLNPYSVALFIILKLIRIFSYTIFVMEKLCAFCEAGKRL